MTRWLIVGSIGVIALSWAILAGLCIAASERDRITTKPPFGGRG